MGEHDAPVAGGDAGLQEDLLARAAARAAEAVVDRVERLLETAGAPAGAWLAEIAIARRSLTTAFEQVDSLLARLERVLLAEQQARRSEVRDLPPEEVDRASR